ncbi:hypothetical protein B484DRAFT_452186 [Ochromonadaceae sp. CCMP2298]|nr:hypothetical protein B484DRAFT_452186 [Ochromonadaceae sp. CCMP2298]
MSTLTTIGSTLSSLLHSASSLLKSNAAGAAGAVSVRGQGTSYYLGLGPGEEVSLRPDARRSRQRNRGGAEGTEMAPAQGLESAPTAAPAPAPGSAPRSAPAPTPIVGRSHTDTSEPPAYISASTDSSKTRDVGEEGASTGQGGGRGAERRADNKDRKRAIVTAGSKGVTGTVRNTGAVSAQAPYVPKSSAVGAAGGRRGRNIVSKAPTPAHGLTPVPSASAPVPASSASVSAPAPAKSSPSSPVAGSASAPPKVSASASAAGDSVVRRPAPAPRVMSLKPVPAQ